MRQRLGVSARFPAVRSLALVVGLGLCSGFTTGCVPYQQYIKAEDNLRMTLALQRDLEQQLKEAEIRLARHGGSEGIAKANYNEMRVRYEELLDENGTLRSANAALIDQINNLPAFDPNPATGFTADDERESGMVLGGRGQLIMDGNVLFAPGKIKLRDDAKRNLGRLASLISSKYSDRILSIYGHTDVSRIKNSRKLYTDNWELGLKRAHAVFKFLASKGVTKEQMRLGSSGYAEPAEGVADASSKEGMAQCRRVEVYLGDSR